MPPGQPVHRCDDCGFIRPCRPFAGRWLCLECAPVTAVATDGGEQ